MKRDSPGGVAGTNDIKIGTSYIFTLTLNKTFFYENATGYGIIISDYRFDVDINITKNQI